MSTLVSKTRPFIKGSLRSQHTNTIKAHRVKHGGNVLGVGGDRIVGGYASGKASVVSPSAESNHDLSRAGEESPEAVDRHERSECASGAEAFGRRKGHDGVSDRRHQVGRRQAGVVPSVREFPSVCAHIERQER